MAWLFLAAAIAFEITGTLGLRAIAQGPAQWAAIALITVSYAVSFACMTLALRSLNVGVVYAIWSAVGTAAVAIAGVALFGDRLTWTTAAGMVLIVLGVVVVVGSGATRHP
jgi:small multidrug resistance pump